jgi:hypothetical protein
MGDVPLDSDAGCDGYLSLNDDQNKKGGQL